MVESIEKVLNRIKSSIPMGRLAKPSEIARVVHFLAADAGGTSLDRLGVNGGLDMSRSPSAPSSPSVTSNSQTTHRKVIGNAVF